MSCSPRTFRGVQIQVSSLVDEATRVGREETWRGRSKCRTARDCHIRIGYTYTRVPKGAKAYCPSSDTTEPRSNPWSRLMRMRRIPNPGDMSLFMITFAKGEDFGPTMEAFRPLMLN